MGFRPLAAPVLRFRSIAVPAGITLGADDALAFTSIQGVRRAAALIDQKHYAVFAVGDATAEVARNLGFTRVASANGDVGALTKLIVEARPGGSVVHPSALETTGDLVGALKAQGVRAHGLAVYRTQALSRLPDMVGSALKARTLGAVLIHSPKAGRITAKLLASSQGSVAGVTGFGLSKACLAPLRESGLKALVGGEDPTEHALMVALAGELASLA